MLEPEDCAHENAEWTGVTLYLSPLLYEWECPDCGWEWIQRGKDEVGRPYLASMEQSESVEEGYIHAPYIPRNRPLQPKTHPVGHVFCKYGSKHVDTYLYGETVIEQRFTDLLKRAIDVKGKKWLAGYFQAAVSTIERWASGDSEPHNSIREYIERELSKVLGMEYENNEDVEVNVELHGEISVNPPDPLELLSLCIHGKISEKMVVDVHPDEVTRYLEEHPYWERSYSSIFQLKGPEGKPGSVREHNGWHWAEETRIGLRPYNSWHEVVRKIASAECRGEIEVLLQIKLGMDTQEFEDFLYGA